QCAGFLRIPEAQNPLDNTAVHPERYALVERMAADMGTDVRGLIADAEVRQRAPLRRYVSDEVGPPTLSDIMDELSRPGRDPRGRAEAFAFAPGIRTIDDLQIGMVLPGIVTNVTAFGAFVDVGIKTKGLVHVSQLADRYVKDPSAVVALQQQVRVRVLEIDYRRGRIALSMRGL
ncbi:MAG: S1 RNA-binding domain-containing protein, partial [Bacteroidales bacterium]|nr:S1 RNA-binding domain-containing protein [Candidatus Equimonas enterica]